jgi:hypothetical protein
VARDLDPLSWFERIEAFLVFLVGAERLNAVERLGLLGRAGQHFSAS